MDASRFFTGLFRRFRTCVLGREVEVIGQCKLCGRCCEDILIEDQGRFFRREKKFHKLCQKEPEYERFQIVSRDDFGHLTFNCSKLGDDKFCTDYEGRLSLCKDYPNKSIYYQGGGLRADCGFSFKAVTFRDIYMRRRRSKVPEFSEVLRQEQKQTDK